MATTRKTTSASNNNTQKAQNPDVGMEQLKNENEALKTQLNDLQQQMAQVTQMIQQMNMMNQFMTKTSDTTVKDIELISLISGKLVLTTTGKSDGRHYEFAKQFDTVLVPEGDLKLIIKAMPRTTENGCFFINDVEFVNKNGLSGVYKNIMSQQKIEEFFVKPFNEAMQIYRSANKAQKSILEAMVTDKCLNNEFVDANVLMMLSKETGKDFMNIEPLLKEE